MTHLHLVEEGEQDAARKAAGERTQQFLDGAESVLTRLLMAHMRDEEAFFANGPFFADRDVYPIDLWPEDSARRLRPEEAVTLAVDAVIGVLWARIPDARRAHMGDGV